MFRGPFPEGGGPLSLMPRAALPTAGERSGRVFDRLPATNGSLSTTPGQFGLAFVQFTVNGENRPENLL